MNGIAPNTDCLKQLLPANNIINADASHREFLKQLRQVQAYPQSASSDVEITGVFTGIWKKGSVPELQVTTPLSAWNDSKHWTIKPQVQILLDSEELKVSCKTAFFAVVKVATSSDGAILAERLMLLSIGGETIHVKGIGHTSILLVTIEPFSGSTEDLLKTSIIVRSSAASERVNSISEKQRLYEEMLEELSEKVATVDVVDDLQKLKTTLAGLRNVATDHDSKADRMQMDIDTFRDDHRDLSCRVEMIGEEMTELRGELGVDAFEATNIKLAVRSCELTLEADKEHLDELVAENSRLSDAAKALQERAERQDRHIVELRTAAERHEAALGHFKMLTYATGVAFVAFLALLFIY